MANENLKTIRERISETELANLREAYPCVADAIDAYEKYDISKANVSVADQTHTGSALTPDPTVVLGGITLVKNTHYTVAYGDNTNVGDSAYVTVTGVSPYFWQKKVYFTIAEADE